jgi:peptidoglycan/LPS O-acetylase OafA/YrhL
MIDSISRDKNNFGFLRLSFATLVILAHSPEIIDGNGSREILCRIFGTISFGDLAVDGFFLVSGYLITLSYLRSKSNVDYLLKRVLRIYPGYIVAFLFSLIVVGLLVGGRIADLRSELHLNLPAHLLLLDEPELKSAFTGLGVREATLNASMWTLIYEFRCYCVLMILGAMGVLRNRKVFLGITAVLVEALIVMHENIAYFHIHINVHTPVPTLLLHYLIGDPIEAIRLYAIFFCGGCFFLFSDKIVYRSSLAIVAGAALFNLMYSFQLAEAAIAVLGGYILFWFALSVKTDWLGRVGSKNDLSYGIYIYAWPIQMLTIWYFRHISPWLLVAITVPIASALAYGSWVCVERPFLNLKGRLRLNKETSAVVSTGRNELPHPAEAQTI